MKSIRTAAVQATAPRRAYAAPQLTNFGSVSTLTAGGSGNAGENGNMDGMAANMMGARP